MRIAWLFYIAVLLLHCLGLKASDGVNVVYALMALGGMVAFPRISGLLLG